MFRKILAAVDGSKTARKAAGYAVELAGKLKAELILVNVIDLSVLTARQYVAGKKSPTHLIEPIDDYLRQAAEAFMDGIEALANEGKINLRRSIRSGKAAREIIREAEDSGADLIVMGSHGRKPISSMLLGSVALGVLSGTKIPTLIVRS
ncbi:MAG: universal stress protein [Syntrophales bacterium]|jgi:nucleotide-binding universal stress UspA family protein|nr:universal stress protein [Syntrophales bacterium]MDD5232628.1 universal stress protein [Syntrophales bacterium]MDD5532599.1 universal stress protein [Syntrophales bacterium]HPL62155.1 universal stress protein [Syntrophales bacterium]